uniref:CHK kinase-like domain-containing protein n=1 Tax=Panagrolaimus sp. JU765 TaxID=591449 RepID=A0AC34QRA5_9BILA
MTLERFVADLLGHHQHRDVHHEENDQLAPLLDGCREFFIEARNDYFLIVAVEESEFDVEKEVDLKYLSNLAGFYNARYLYELVKFESIRFPVGTFAKFFKPVTFGHKDYAVFAIQLPRPILPKDYQMNGHDLPHFLQYSKNRKLELTLNQAFNIAEKLCTLHEACLPEKRKKEAREIIEENYQLISELTSERLQTKVNDYLEIILEKNGQFFKNTDKTFERFSALFKTFKELQEIYPESNLPLVLCHGNLTAQNLVFGTKDEVIFIDHWENIHFGSVVEDLSYLIITSLSPHLRRNNYMKIFRRYYYTLIDTRSIKFKLHEIKDFYLRFLKYAVFYSLPTLTAILESQKYSDEEKFRAVTRWEATVDDAFDVETGDYLSDNEDLLTAQNSENRSVTEAVLRTRH